MLDNLQHVTVDCFCLVDLGGNLVSVGAKKFHDNIFLSSVLSHCEFPKIVIEFVIVLGGDAFDIVDGFSCPLVST